MRSLSSLGALLVGGCGLRCLVAADSKNQAAVAAAPRSSFLSRDATSSGGLTVRTLRGAVNGGGQFADLSPSSFMQSLTKTRRATSRQPEELEQWQDSGNAIEIDHTSISPASLIGMSHSIDAKAYHDELHDLCDAHPSRFVGRTGNVATSTKIKEKFEALKLQTWVEDIKLTPKLTKFLSANASLGGNVIGLLKGTDLAHEVVILGAHYDSVNWENTEGRAPGVDDNGSGSALVQLVARALVNAKVKPRRSMMFVGFNAEEEYLSGSDQLAQKAGRGDYGDVKAVLIADEVAYPGSGDGSRRAIFETVGTVDGTSALLDTFAKNAQVRGGDGISGFEVNKKGFGSDHISFLQHNIPAVLLIERNNMAHADKWGHSARDDWSHVDMDYGAAMTRLMLRTAAALGSPARANETKTSSPYLTTVETGIKLKYGSVQSPTTLHLTKKVSFPTM